MQGNLGLSVFPKDTTTCAREEPGVKLPTQILRRPTLPAEPQLPSFGLMPSRYFLNKSESNVTPRPHPHTQHTNFSPFSSTVRLAIEPTGTNPGGPPHRWAYGLSIKSVKYLPAPCVPVLPLNLRVPPTAKSHFNPCVLPWLFAISFDINAYFWKIPHSSDLTFKVEVKFRQQAEANVLCNISENVFRQWANIPWKSKWGTVTTMLRWSRCVI